VGGIGGVGGMREEEGRPDGNGRPVKSYHVSEQVTTSDDAGPILKNWIESGTQLERLIRSFWLIK
jgi:predicted transcriptional regulator